MDFNWPTKCLRGPLKYVYPICRLPDPCPSPPNPSSLICQRREILANNPEHTSPFGVGYRIYSTLLLLSGTKKSASTLLRRGITKQPQTATKSPPEALVDRFNSNNLSGIENRTPRTRYSIVFLATGPGLALGGGSLEGKGVFFFPNFILRSRRERPTPQEFWTFLH